MQLTLDCTACRNSLPYGDIALRCPECGEPLEVCGYHHPCISRSARCQHSLVERYAAFLPAGDRAGALSLGEGFTPLVNVPALASELGISQLLIKNETVNPTWSFKDRGTMVALAEAVAMGFAAVGVVSTGNMAASVAAYGTHADVPVLVLVSADTPEEKLVPIAVYGPTVVRVRGDYADLYDATLGFGTSGIRFLNSDAPARVEGSKTIAFEICEQTGYNVPDWVVVPTSSGGNLRGIVKGFEEMRGVGLIARVPRIVCAQAEGCAPIAEAWRQGSDEIVPVAQPQTIAHAIKNPRPPSGNAVLRTLRAFNGICVAVSDAHTVRSQVRMAGAGVFGQPAAAVPLAAAMSLSTRGELRRDEVVVCVATGSGLKYPGSVESMLPPVRDVALADLKSYVAEWCGRRLPRR